jgi:hypothetical protein
MRITMLKLECKYMVHSGKKGEQNTAWPTIYRHQKIQGLHTSGFCSLMPQNSTVRPNFTALLSYTNGLVWEGSSYTHILKKVISWV